MSESRRRTISQSDVTSPTTPVPKSETATSTTATATPSNATPIKAVPMPPPLDPVPDSKKAKKRYARSTFTLYIIL